MDVSVNYLAIVAAAAAAMVIGAVWYGPLFGKRWRVLTGISMEEMKSMPLTPIQAMGIGFVVMLVMAYVLNHVIALGSAYYNETGTTSGLMTAFWVWLGFVATTQVGVVLWEGKSWKLFGLNTIYSLVSLGVMSIILVLWP